MSNEITVKATFLVIARGKGADSREIRDSIEADLIEIGSKYGVVNPDGETVGCTVDLKTRIRPAILP